MSAAAMHPAHSSRALRVNEKAADLDALRLEAAPQAEPVPPSGHPVVRVAAAAVDPSDRKGTIGP